MELTKFIREKSILKWTIILFVFLIIVYIANKIANNLQVFTIASVNNEIDAFLYLLTGIGTIGLALVAWFQVKKISANSEAEFLLKIDQRWNSREILVAREIIHRFYLDIYKDENNDKKNLDQIYEILAKKVKDISEDKREVKKFIYILNFLDFMETIGYLCEGKHITHTSLDSLCGESLEFNYFKVFEPYINEERKKYGKPTLYAAFEQLYFVRSF